MHGVQFDFTPILHVLLSEFLKTISFLSYKIQGSIKELE